MLLQFWGFISYKQFTLFSVGLRNLLLLWLAYQGIFLPLVKKELKALLFFEKENEKLEQLDINTLSKKLEDFLLKNEAYLNPDVTIEQMALYAGVPPRELSYYFNHIIGCTFREYLNKLRVDAMLDYLQKHAGEYIKVEWLVLQFGFKNSLTAQRAFKKVTGKTIGSYIVNPVQN